MSEETLLVLLETENILWNFYDKWLAKDDSNYNEMETHITEEMEIVVAEANRRKAA
jgi:hypothetical protein